jgi:hypothetical protein
MTEFKTIFESVNNKVYKRVTSKVVPLVLESDHF